MCDHYNSPEAFNVAMSYVHLVLCILLLVEVGLRVFAYRKEFFVNSWNRFDVVLVIFLVIGKLKIIIIYENLLVASLLFFRTHHFGPFRKIFYFRFSTSDGQNFPIHWTDFVILKNPSMQQKSNF